MAFCGGGFEKDSQHIYKSAPLKKHPLSIPIKMAFCTPYWEQCLPFVYRKPIQQIVISLYRHRKLKTAPLLKNIPHLYEKNRGFGNPFWWSLTRNLQFIYKNWPYKRKTNYGSDRKATSELILRAWTCSEIDTVFSPQNEVFPFDLKLPLT